MSVSPYLASTYLRVLHADDHLMAVLNSLFGERAVSVLNSEFVTVDDIKSVFELCAEHGMDSWVLRYGTHISVGSHGPLGFTVLSAPNLSVALQVLAEFTIIRTSTYRCELVERGNRLELTAIDQSGAPLVGRWLIETGFSVAQRLIETIMAHPLGDNAIMSFNYPRPSYASKLEAYYGIRCEFDAQVCGLSIPASWAQITSPLSDPETFRSNLAKCQEIKLKQLGELDIGESIRLAMDQYFRDRAAGQHKAIDLPDLKQLANKHHMSKRTLARKLQEHQQSYKQLLQAVRKQHAVDLLENTHLSIAHVAELLAYQEPANFIRAFKSWFSMSPTHWRRTRTDFKP